MLKRLQLERIHTVLLDSVIAKADVQTIFDRGRRTGRSAPRGTTNRCQLHGANGLPVDFEVDRCFRDAQMLTIAEGTTEICKIIVSNSVINSALK